MAAKKGIRTHIATPRIYLLLNVFNEGDDGMNKDFFNCDKDRMWVDQGKVDHNRYEKKQVFFMGGWEGNTFLNMWLESSLFNNDWSIIPSECQTISSLSLNLSSLH